MPRPTAPELTTITSISRSRRVLIWLQSAAMRAVSKLPMPDVRTPVQSLITTRLECASMAEARGQKSDGRDLWLLFLGLYLLQVGFFFDKVIVDFGDVVVVRFLHVFFVALVIIFRQAIAFRGFE